jgi:excisionase family DNA binding protein
MTNKKVLNRRETAEFIGASENTVKKLIDEGVIPAIRAGRRIFVPVQALENWLATAEQNIKK